MVMVSKVPREGGHLLSSNLPLFLDFHRSWNSYFWKKSPYFWSDFPQFLAFFLLQITNLKEKSKQLKSELGKCVKINPIIVWDYIWGKTYPKNPFLYSMQQNSFVKNLPVHLCALRCGGNFISLQYETKKVFLAKRISLLLLCWKTTQSGWMTKQKKELNMAGGGG